MLIPDIVITPMAIERLSDEALLARLITTVASHRRSTAEILMLLGEVDARKLHLQQGCTSLFLYCTEVLRFSESEAYHRIHAAHTIRRFPDTLKLLQAGALTLTTIKLLSPHLTLENYPSLLASASQKTKREVEAIVATLAPKADVGTLVRRLPVSSGAGRLSGEFAAANRSEGTTACFATGDPSGTPTDSAGETGPPTAGQVQEEGQVARGEEYGAAKQSSPATGPASSDVRVDGSNGQPSSLNSSSSPGTPAGPSRGQPAARAFLAPLSADRYLLRLTISAETHTKLRYAQNLSRHAALAAIWPRSWTGR